MELNIKIAKMEENLHNIEDKLDSHCQDQKISDSKIEKRFEESQSQMNDRFDYIQTMIKEFIAASDNKFAPIWVKDAIVWVIRIVVSAVIIALLGLVIAKTNITDIVK